MFFVETSTSVTIAFVDPQSVGRTKTIKQINENVDRSQLVRWTKALIAVTTNSYVSTTLTHVVKDKLD